MRKLLLTLALLCAGATRSGAADAQPVNPVVQWNRTLLGIVRTPGAQPPTVHATRSFAIMHAAIYDAVDAIDGTHAPYAVVLAGATVLSAFLGQDRFVLTSRRRPCRASRDRSAGSPPR